MSDSSLTSPYVLVSTGVALFAAAGLLISHQAQTAIEHAQYAPHTTGAEAAAQAEALLQYKCADCHGANAAPNPLLDKLSGGLQSEHIAAARKAFTLEPQPDVRSGLVDYVKMRRVLDTRRMPPASYSAVHLGSRLTPYDVNVLSNRYTATGALLRSFAPVQEAALTESVREAARIQLGHHLYNDTRLSTDNTVACATCHDLRKGGTDNKPKSDGVRGADGKPLQGGVNAPTVFNAAGHIRQFWDGRAADLKEQAGGPPLNPVEMGYSHPEDWNAIAAKLAQSPELAELFRFVYGEAGITGDTITDAIAAYEKTLVTPDSAFDLYLKGQEDALTEQEKQGFAAFRALGCATCHAGPAMGGLSFENINTHADLRESATAGNVSDHAKQEFTLGCLTCHPDGVEQPVQTPYVDGAHGLADFTKNPAHTDMFRVPTLRNVALTAPYFHTGTVEKLENAVRIMIATQNGTEPTEKHVADITAFLKAQTGKLNGTPLDKLSAEDVKPRPIQPHAAQPVGVVISFENGKATRTEYFSDGHTEVTEEPAQKAAAQEESAE